METTMGRRETLIFHLLLFMRNIAVFLTFGSTYIDVFKGTVSRDFLCLFFRQTARPGPNRRLKKR
jgi:hypothetical protein